MGSLPSATRMSYLESVGKIGAKWTGVKKSGLSQAARSEATCTYRSALAAAGCPSIFSHLSCTRFLRRTTFTTGCEMKQST